MNQYAVIGHPLLHTMSPFIHRKLFALSGQEAEYTVQEIRPEALQPELSRLKTFSGFNVTIPHKNTIIPFLDAVDEIANLYGAVNTVAVKKGKMKGYNTDCIGFLRSLQAAEIPLEGRVVILGAGGAARMMAFEAVKAGADVTFAVRESAIPSAQKIVEEMQKKIGRITKISTIDALEGPIDLLINATPVGMVPHTQSMPLKQELIPRCQNIFDAVYNPSQTQLIRAGEAQGCRCEGGMAMLVWQAAAAQTIWHSVSFSTSAIQGLIQDSIAEMKKLFL